METIVWESLGNIDCICIIKHITLKGYITFIIISTAGGFSSRSLGEDLGLGQKTFSVKDIIL